MDAEVWEENILPCHMNSILVESWDAFRVLSCNIIREIFVKTKLPPLSPPKLTVNTQDFPASVQVSSGPKDK